MEDLCPYISGGVLITIVIQRCRGTLEEKRRKELSLKVMTRDEEKRHFAKAKKGNNRAFSKLVRPLMTNLKYRAMKAFGCPDEAEDIVQTALINAYTKLSTFREESRFSTWFYAIGTNVIRMRLITLARVPPMVRAVEDETVLGKTSVLGETPHTGQPESLLGLNQERKMVSEAIQDLPPMYAQVIHLQVVRDYTLKEIEAETGLTVPTIKTRLFRAKKRVAELCAA